MSIDFKSSKGKRWIIAAVAFASVVAYCAPPGTFHHIDFEFTGTVRDKETKEPLEGAYVVATYSVAEANLAASSINCKKTKGMFTGKDGRFHFPIERLDNLNPGDVTAIKPGYYGAERLFPTLKAGRAAGVEANSNRDLFLIKQNPDKPEFRFGDYQEICMHAEYKDDVEASIQFLKIEVAEALRLNAETWRVDNIKSRLGRVENLHAKR